MTRELRWRIVTLQVVVVLVFGFLAGTAYWASNFVHDQVTNQLAPQQISFPADEKSGLPADLTAYAGQQVLNGDQAHAYADHFIAVHLNSIGEGKPYSYWSTVSRTEKDPVKKAEYDATTQTLFRGETLRSMLNQAWAFWTMGTVAMYAAIGLAIGTLAVLAALVYELAFAPRREQTIAGVPARASAS